MTARPEAPTLDEKIEGQRNIIARLDDAEGLRIANGILESLLELDKLKRMAATGTAENFLQCADETKRSLFAIGIIESSARKKAEERLRAIEQAAGMPDEPENKWASEADPYRFIVYRADYEKLTAHCLHLQTQYMEMAMQVNIADEARLDAEDRLARMEALLRELYDEAQSRGALPSKLCDKVDAALLAKIAKEKV